MVPNSSRIKTLTRTLNSEFEIRNAPNGVGVQQSLHGSCDSTDRERSQNESDVPDTIRTGDGTQIARGLSVVNIGFTVLEERQNRVCSAYRKNSIAILKMSEKYEEPRG